jgi:hypothetical protein
MRKTFDPLKYIPSADAIRKRLDETRELARKLAILLKTAEGLERKASAERPQGDDDGR